MATEDEERVTLTDIANRMDVSKRAVRAWRDIDGWPTSAGTVTRQGRDWTAWRWGEVQEFCLAHGLPQRSRQEGVRRANRARRDNQ